MYYKNKLDTLKDIFGTERLHLKEDMLLVDDRAYPIVNDVIILSPSEKQSDLVKNRLDQSPFGGANEKSKPFAEDIQYTFGQEWKRYDKILPEHREEFSQYFDIVDLKGLGGMRVCDLGCGNGRWSYFLKDAAKEIILVDFSDAIFTARKNLSGADNCLFFMCDLKDLPFKDDFAGFLFCLGVLHHLPTPCLDEVRNIKRLASTLLIYLYYSLDNRPSYFRTILKAVTFFRARLCKIRSPFFRKALSISATLFIYIPLILAGHLLSLFGLGRFVPLYEAYRHKSVGRIQQDAYDRFFTRIEQRVSREDILGLKDAFAEIVVSDKEPYWHFLCKR